LKSTIQRNLGRLHLLQARIHASLDILLLALQLRDFAGQLFVLPAQSGDLRPQLLVLVGHLQQAALTGRARLARLAGEPAELCIHFHPIGIEFLPQVQDGLARLVVIEQGMGLQRPQAGDRQEGRPQQ
jgi:hypothetical protein